MDWISVKDRLPTESVLDKREMVIAWFDYGSPARNKDLQQLQFAEISNGHWRPISGNGNFDEYVTHWMPLPEAPK